MLNIADPVALSVAEIGKAIGRRMGYAGTFRPLPGHAFPAALGRNPWSVPRPFVLDTRAAQAIGYVPVTTYPQIVGDVCDDLVRATGRGDWKAAFPILADYRYDLFDYAAEDEAA